MMQQKLSNKELLRLQVTGKIEGILIHKDKEHYLCDLEGAKELIRK